MVKYSLLEKQQEFFNIPHNNSLDVVIYQGGYGSGKTWCGSLLGIMLARKYPGCRGLVCAKEYVLVRDTTLESYFSHLETMGYVAGNGMQLTILFGMLVKKQVCKKKSVRIL